MGTCTFSTLIRPAFQIRNLMLVRSGDQTQIEADRLGVIECDYRRHARLRETVMAALGDKCGDRQFIFARMTTPFQRQALLEGLEVFHLFSQGVSRK